MTNPNGITIIIGSTTLTPSLAPQVTQQETVHFKLGEDITVGEIDLYFDHPERLVGSPNPLHVGRPDGASVVIDTYAPKGIINYSERPYDERPPQQANPRGGQTSPKPPPKGGGDVVTGGLDVTTEPPPPPEE
ncbi:MAG TPA: hypothetical protein VK458_10060 [Myxococcaceae bacterium]|nr:hypothetical protein [Myxococcaceae bacterium]